jgi:hypothetical protein
MPSLKKTTAKTTLIKGMSVVKVKESAIRIVNLEIGKQLSPAGRQACLDIGVLLVQLLDVYRVYANEVGHMTIDLATISSYFKPESWAKLTNNQRLVLEAGIQAQGLATQAAIDKHMAYLLENKAGMDSMGPNGQAAALARLLELQGVPAGEEVAGGH